MNDPQTDDGCPKCGMGTADHTTLLDYDGERIAIICHADLPDEEA